MKQQQPKNTIIGYILTGVIFFIVGYVYYSNFIKKNSDKTETNIHTNDTNYNIRKVNLNNEIGFNVDVEIFEKLDDQELLEISRTVEEEIHAKKHNGKVFFYLPEMESGTGCWARVDLNQDSVVEIIGMSRQDEDKITNNVDKIGDCYGLWIDNFSSGDAVIRIRQKGTKYFFEYVSATNTKDYKTVSQLKMVSNYSTKFIVLDDNEDETFYEVEANGNLAVYDKLGYIATYKKIR